MRLHPVYIIFKFAAMSNWWYSSITMKNITHITTLRVPKDLYEKIRRIAKENHRSINAQIVHILTIRVDANKGAGNG